MVATQNSLTQCWEPVSTELLVALSLTLQSGLKLERTDPMTIRLVKIRSVDPQLELARFSRRMFPIPAWIQIRFLAVTQATPSPISLTH